MGLASRIVRGYVSRNKLIRNKQVHGSSSHEEMLLLLLLLSRFSCV